MKQTKAIQPKEEDEEAITEIQYKPTSAAKTHACQEKQYHL